MGCLSPSDVSNILQSQFDGISGSLENILPDFTNELSAIENNINNLIQTPAAVLENKVSEILSASDGWLSDYASDECYQSVIEWIAACNFFSDNPFLRDPIRFLQTIQSNMVNYILDKIRAISDSLPEIHIAAAIADVWYRMNSGPKKIIDAFSRLLDISDCFSDLGGEIAAIIDAIDDMIDSVFLTISDLGNIILNIPKLFLGIAETVINSIMGIVSVITSILNDALNKINTGIEFFRNKVAQLQKIEDIIKI